MMEKAKTKTGYHHGDLRQALVAAIREQVEEKGADGFSISEACRGAGVSTAAPYNHFTGRADMLRAVALDGFQEMAESFRAALDGLEPGSVEAIAAIGTAYVSYAERNPGVFRMMFAGGYEKDEALEEAGRACYGMLLEQIARRLGRTEVDEEVLREGFPLWTFVHGLSFLRIDGKADFAGVERGVRDIVLEGTRRLLA